MPEFRNPNAGGGSQDNRSFLVMMIVMIGVIVGLQYWRSQHNPPPAPTTPPAQTTTQTAAPPQTTAFSQSSPAPAAKPGVAPTPTIAAPAETSTVVENELYRITFSNRGGEVRSWILKRYKDTTGQPLDLVHDGASKLFGYPLSLYTYDAALTRALAQALYVPSATGVLQSPASLSFNFSSGNITVHKTFTFGADYVIHADTVVLRDGAPIRALLAWPAGFGDMESAAAYGNSQIDSSSNGHDDHTAFKKVSGGATLPGPFDFAGASDQYFAAIFLPDSPSDSSLATLYNQADFAQVVIHQPWYRFGNLTLLSRTAVTPALATTPTGSLRLPVLGAALGGISGHTLTRLFVGPKDIDVLKSIHTASNTSLEPLLDFGFFGPIGKYLFLGLHAVHSALPQDRSALRNYSWGWSIVLFTVLINLVLLPLRVQGMRSALKMQRIQPQVDAIKAKFKNPKPTDPKAAEMNAEIMAYQKEQGVSMFGGCVPSLIQLPLLFAFFTMMNHVVELRQAHFFWLPDLSLADPYHILPISMVLTSFLVQFYTPSPGVDPQQQRMMAFMMPVFSGYWTWTYASGLALYWNVGNIIMIIQQLVMNRTSLGREMREIAAKRARKLAASKVAAKPIPPRTIQGRR